MKEFTEEIFRKMMEEDHWLRSENGRELISIVQSSYDIPATLPMAVEIAESDTADHIYKKSAALHCILGELYQSLPHELSDETKRVIELSKLERIGDQRLFECRNMSPSELADFFSNETINIPLEEGRTFGINFEAAAAYIRLANIRNYMYSNNSTRAYHHFNESLKLSNESNFTVFEQMVEPMVLLYMVPLVQAGMAAFNGKIPNYISVYPLLGWLNDEYKAARMRVGMMHDTLLLPQLSIVKPSPI